MTTAISIQRVEAMEKAGKALLHGEKLAGNTAREEITLAQADGELFADFLKVRLAALNTRKSWPADSKSKKPFGYQKAMNAGSPGGAFYNRLQALFGMTMQADPKTGLIIKKVKPAVDKPVEPSVDPQDNGEGTVEDVIISKAANLALNDEKCFEYLLLNHGSVDAACKAFKAYVKATRARK